MRSWQHLQRLAPRQRAALLLHDVLGFSQPETAEVLAVSTSAVNSLLGRARQTVRASSRVPAPDLASARVRSLLESYVRAWQLADIDAFIQLIAEDIRFSMPPMSAWFDGRDAVAQFVGEAIFATRSPARRDTAGGRVQRPARIRELYQPDGAGSLILTGLQIVQLG